MSGEVDARESSASGVAIAGSVACADHVARAEATPRRLTLCADDFGQSAAISGGILQLIAAGRLQATSVLSQGPDWSASAPALKELVTGEGAPAEAGLHLNLTHAFAHAEDARPLSAWLLASQLRQVSRLRVRDSFLHQVDAFVAQLGRLPDYVDGHQHVHAFPVVRDALLDVIERCWPVASSAIDDRPWLRVPERLVGAPGLKSAVLRLATRGFGKLAEARGLRTSPAFAGVYALRPDDDFAGRMRGWLRESPDGTLIMCHPGLPAGCDDAADPIAAARSVEFTYLASDAFIDALRQYGVTLSRFAARH